MTNNKQNSVFITQDELSDDDIGGGKTTYTDIYNTIPKNKKTKSIKNWRKKYYTEWRWRFLQINKRLIAEISYVNYNCDKRIYYNRRGKRVQRDISDVFDKYVVREFYSYE